MTYPTAFDEAGIRMLDSIREIFDIIGIRFELIGSNYDEYTEFKQLVAALKAGKCPVIGVDSHAMVATGIKNKKGVQNIQLKNSYADNPDQPGKVQFNKPIKYSIYFLAVVMNYYFILYEAYYII